VLSTLLLSLSLHAAEVELVNDPFDSISLDTTKWVDASISINGSATGGQHPVAVSNGKLTADVTVLSGSHRSTIISKAANLNPFDAPITLTFTGLTLNGGTTTGANYFYAMLGNISNDADGTGNAYYSNQTPAGQAGYVSLKIWTSNGGLRIQVGERTASVNAGSGDPYLNNATIPSTIVLTLDGANWALTFPGCGLIGWGMAAVFLRLF
jgi:hypothetical protein